MNLLGIKRCCEGEYEKTTKRGWGHCRSLEYGGAVQNPEVPIRNAISKTLNVGGEWLNAESTRPEEVPWPSTLRVYTRP